MKIHNVTSILTGTVNSSYLLARNSAVSKYLSGWRTDQPVVLKWPCSFLFANSPKNSTLLTWFFPWGEGVLSEFSPLHFTSLLTEQVTHPGLVFLIRKMFIINEYNYLSISLSSINHSEQCSACSQC